MTAEEPLTVRKLITRLQKLDPDALVYVEDYENDNYKLAKRVVPKAIFADDDPGTQATSPVVLISRFDRDPVEVC